MEGCSDGETPQESKSSADKCMWSWATVLSVSMMSLVMMSVNTLIIFRMYYSTVLFFTRKKKKEIPLSVLPKTQQFQSVYSLTPISDISGRYSDYGTDWPQTTTAQEGFHFQAIPGLMRFKKKHILKFLFPRLLPYIKKKQQLTFTLFTKNNVIHQKQTSSCTKYQLKCTTTWTTRLNP